MSLSVGLEWVFVRVRACAPVCVCACLSVWVYMSVRYAWKCTAERPVSVVFADEQNAVKRKRYSYTAVWPFPFRSFGELFQRLPAKENTDHWLFFFLFSLFLFLFPLMKFLIFRSVFCSATLKQTNKQQQQKTTNQPTNDSRACLKSSALATDIMLTLKMRSELYHVTKTNPHEHKRKQIPSHTYTHTQTHTRTHTHTHTKQNKQNTNISSLTVTAFCPNSSSYLLVLIEF